MMEKKYKMHKHEMLNNFATFIVERLLLLYMLLLQCDSIFTVGDMYLVLF